jgi:alcohol dehydrogenase
MACGDPRASCRVAILDPNLTLTQPPKVTALTGIDAISHALETYVTKVRTPFSMALSRQAFRLLIHGLPKVLDTPSNVKARSDMQMGACLAGMAIEASMLGAAHATANPLTAAYGIPHGQAVGVMLPAVVKLNGLENPASYADLAMDLGQPERSPSEAVDQLTGALRGLLLLAGLKTNLRDLEVPEDDLKMLAESALKQWTGSFNPVPLTKELTYRLYRETYAV